MLKIICYALLFSIGLPVVLVVIVIVKLFWMKDKPEYDDPDNDWDESSWKIKPSGELVIDEFPHY